MSNNLHRRIGFGLFEFDTATGELRRDGTPVKLARQPARVLALLVSRPGDVIARDEFRRELWGEDTFVDFERGLNFCITQTRAALGDAADNPRFIQTVPRRGYRFIAPVWTSGQNPGDTLVGRTTEREIEAAGPPQGESGDAERRWGRRSVAAAAAAAIALLVWWTAAGRPWTSAATVTTPVRVAVLPFANLTGDATLDYLADSITDEVITQLGSLSRNRIAVIARTSAMTYRHRQKAIPDVAHELNVQYIVEGSVRREGETLRIASSFVPVHEQAAVSWWSDGFARTAATLDAHQTPAAIRIARHVATQLLPDTDAVTPRASPANAQAWDGFMQASVAIHRGTPADVRTAIRLLEAAVERDPTFAAAWARIAEAQHMLVMMGAAKPLDAYPAARAAADRALAIAPHLAQSHLAHGLVQLWYDWQPADAALSFERALALNPSLAAAHHDYAWALVATGRTDDAVRHIQRSRDLDPLSTRANTDVGWLRLFLRQPEQAARACEHTLALDHSSLEAPACLERAYTQQSRFESAIHAARMTLPGEDAPQVRAGEDGLRDIWSWRLRRLERAADTRWVSPYTLAVHHALVGERDRAIAALDEAVRQRVGVLVFLARDPAFDALRDDARFADLLKRVSGRRW